MKKGSFHIRKAGEKDDAKIGDLLVRVFISTYAQKMPEVVVGEERKRDLRNVEERRRNGVVLVVDNGDEVVATVSLIPYGKTGSEAWSEDASSLRMMVIDPKYHGQNLSQNLIAECERITGDWGLKAIELHIRRGAHGISKMYERLGFRRAPEGDADHLPEIFLEAFRKEIES